MEYNENGGREKEREKRTKREKDGERERREKEKDKWRRMEIQKKRRGELEEEKEGAKIAHDLRGLPTWAFPTPRMLKGIFGCNTHAVLRGLEPVFILHSLFISVAVFTSLRDGVSSLPYGQLLR